MCDSAQLPAQKVIQNSFVFLMVLVSGTVLHWYCFQGTEDNVTACHCPIFPDFSSNKDSREGSNKAMNIVQKRVSDNDIFFFVLHILAF